MNRSYHVYFHMLIVRISLKRRETYGMVLTRIFKLVYYVIVLWFRTKKL